MDTGRITPLTLAFASAAMEADYWARHLPRMRIQTAISVATVGLLYVAFGLLDYLLTPQVALQLGLIRWSVFAQCVGIVLLTRTALFERAHQAIIASLPVVGGLGILAIIVIAGDVGAQLYYVGLVLAILWTLLISDLRFIYGLPICVGYVIGYEVIAIVLRPMEGPLLLSQTFFLVSALVMCGFAGYISERNHRRAFCHARLTEYEHERAEGLLANTLPKEIVDTLKQQSGTIARRHEAVSILFADVSGFTALSAQMSPEAMVELLNETFSHFDSLVEKHGLEKIRTIGDNYMVAAGAPRPRADHAQALARLALAMRDYANGAGQGRLQFRFGIASGPVVAGVIGHKKFQYDLWGEPVNIASRMESHGVAGEIQITRQTYELLKDEFICEPRGAIAIKSVGDVETWLLVSRKPAPQPAAVPTPCPLRLADPLAHHA